MSSLKISGEISKYFLMVTFPKTIRRNLKGYLEIAKNRQQKFTSAIAR